MDDEVDLDASMSSWLVSFVPAWTTSIQPVVARPMLGSDFAWDSGHTGSAEQVFCLITMYCLVPMW